MENYIDYLKEGSSIHIKKKNRGKFTDYCGGKVTAECIARGKNSPSATIRKRATFAANARKWKHENGGIVKASMGTNLFIGLGREVSRNLNLTDEQYKQAIEDISKSADVKDLELNLPDQESTDIKQSTPTEKTDWTAGYRIGEGTSETTPTTTQTTATTIKPDMSKARSDRNNNPLNIRFTNIAWQGKKTDGKSDKDFEEFESRDYGWRAAYKNIETKMDRGLNTITKLVSEWAPPTENNTNGYIQFVASKTGIDPNAVLTREDLPKIGAAMAAVESGRRDNIDWDDAARGFKFYLG